MDSESDDSNSFSSWFFSLPGREIYCPIPLSYLQDDFNLQDVPLDEKHDFLLDVLKSDELPEELLGNSEIASYLIRLYEGIHQRYILTKPGIQHMYYKFLNGEFGKCPRALCEGQHVLPMGASAEPLKSTLHLYCPRCQDVYWPSSRRYAKLDGFGFGPTFPHLLIMTCSHILNREIINLVDWKVYIPRVFGFKIHETSSFAQQMQFLRNPPDRYR